MDVLQIGSRREVCWDEFLMDTAEGVTVQMYRPQYRNVVLECNESWEGNGTGGPGWNIKGEFAANGVKNDLKHTRGVLSMARAMHPDSAGSQFFIMVEDAPHLDGQYAAFGKITEGMDVAQAIVNVRRDAMDKPLEPVVIKTIVVE